MSPITRALIVSCSWRGGCTRAVAVSSSIGEALRAGWSLTPLGNDVLCPEHAKEYPGLR